MYHDNQHWDLIILDGAKFAAFDQRLMHLVAGDFDGDGYTEICTDSTWYRMATGERGPLHQRLLFENIQPAVGDLTGDGRMEIICAYKNRADGQNYPIVWYKPGEDMGAPWEMHVLSPDHISCPHDLIVADIDGDGRNEVVAIGVYCFPAEQGVYIYKAGDDITKPWQRTTLRTGYFADGTAASDLDGDGIMEVVSGPFLFKAPREGPFSGKPWPVTELAPDLRSLCRSLTADITGNGRPDVLIIEAEYVDCKLSWFENRTLEDPEHPWLEHPLMDNLYASHTLDSWYDNDGQLHILVAETENGTSAIVNHNARVLDLLPLDKGKSWEINEIYKGQGTWMARALDVDDDGEVEILGATDAAFACFGVHVWKKQPAPLSLNWTHRFIEREKPHPAMELLAVDLTGDGVEDVAAGSFWYHAPTWQRYDLPAYQVIASADIDGDGRMELLATLAAEGAPGDWHDMLTGKLVWLKAHDPLSGGWEMHAIADLGIADRNARIVARLVPGLLGVGKPGLLTHNGSVHQLFALPHDPRGPWTGLPMPVQVKLCPSLLPLDLTGNGLPDLLGSKHWLENHGNGVFSTHTLSGQDWTVGAQALMDVNNNGRVDLILGEASPRGESYTKEARFTQVVWCEQPDDPRTPWPVHVIDHIRGPNSMLVLDVDGDGEDELLVGEHDPHWELHYAHRRLFVYKRTDAQGRAWSRHEMENRFDHDAGLKAIRLANGTTGIISHGSRDEFDHWMNRDGKWLHLWEPVD